MAGHSLGLVALVLALLSLFLSLVVLVLALVALVLHWSGSCSGFTGSRTEQFFNGPGVIRHAPWATRHVA